MRRLGKVAEDGGRRAGGVLVSAEATANERLAAITAAGTSVWLDQIRRSMTENGELARLVERGLAARRDLEPAIFEQAILGSDDYDEQLAELAREGKTTARSTRSSRSATSRTPRRAARGLRRDRRHATASCRSRSTRDLAFDTDRTMEQAREYWELRRPPQRDDQDPGHRRGHAGDRGDDLRGAQHQRHAALRGRGSTRRSPRRYIRGLERRHAEGKSLDINSVASFFVSRVDTEVDKRLEGTRPRRARWARPARQRARRLPALQGDLRRRALRRAARRPARRAAPAVGLDRRQEPGLPAT